MPIYHLQRVFYSQNRPCTPKIVGTFYMQGYKVKEKTAIVPPVSKLSGHPEWLATDRWFSPGPRLSSTNKTDCHDITEILMKVTMMTFTIMGLCPLKIYKISNLKYWFQNDNFSNFWHIIFFYLYTNNHQIQIKFDFDNDAFYHYGVMPLENVLNIKLKILVSGW